MTTLSPPILDGKEPDEATLKRLIRKAVLTGAFYPVLCGSAFKNKGVQPLLDAVVDYLPSPVDVPAIKGIDEDGNEVVRKADDKEPLALLAFKIMDDPFVGTITFCHLFGCWRLPSLTRKESTITSAASIPARCCRAPASSIRPATARSASAACC